MPFQGYKMRWNIINLNIIPSQGYKMRWNIINLNIMPFQGYKMRWNIINLNIMPFQGYKMRWNIINLNIIPSQGYKMRWNIINLNIRLLTVLVFLINYYLSKKGLLALMLSGIHNTGPQDSFKRPNSFTACPAEYITRLSTR